MAKSAAAANVTHIHAKVIVPHVAPDLPTEPEYIKLYIEDIGRIFKLKQGHQKILMYVAACVDYDGIISLTAGRKERIGKKVNQVVKSVDNALGEFVKAGLLHRIGRGDFELDPSIFARGEWRRIRERRMAFEMRTTYSENGGRKIVTNATSVQDDLFNDMAM